MAVTVNYSRIDKYIVRAQLRQPLHVGSASQGTGEVLVDPLDGKPFVGEHCFTPSAEERLFVPAEQGASFTLKERLEMVDEGSVQ